MFTGNGCVTFLICQSICHWRLIPEQVSSSLQTIFISKASYNFSGKILHSHFIHRSQKAYSSKCNYCTPYSSKHPQLTLFPTETTRNITFFAQGWGRRAFKISSSSVLLPIFPIIILMMSEHTRPLVHSDYTIGWICALRIELTAAAEMLDEEHPVLPAADPNDTNSYVLGRIGHHNVVIACLPAEQTGKVSAAIVAKDLIRSFKSVTFGLMVGGGEHAFHINSRFYSNKIELWCVAVSRVRWYSKSTQNYPSHFHSKDI